MQIKFKVHSVTPSSENVTATVNGEQVNATVGAVQVELVSDHYGSLILKFVGSEAEEAKNAFTVDAVKVWSI